MEEGHGQWTIGHLEAKNVADEPMGKVTDEPLDEVRVSNEHLEAKNFADEPMDILGWPRSPYTFRGQIQCPRA